MSVVSVIAGESQISRLTEHVEQLPLRPLSELHFQIIIETLVDALLNLIERGTSQDFLEGEENINRLMVSELLNRLDGEPSEWQSLVRSVQDAANVLNIDGTHLGKQPDISLILSDKSRSANLPFIIESKLISSTKGADRYCRDGLSRFIKGDYAWYDQEAMMLAYVQNQSTTQNKLTPYLKKNCTKEVDSYQTVQLPEPVSWLEEGDLAKSVHKRPINYTSKFGHCKPGDITLWHLWLQIPIS